MKKLLINPSKEEVKNLNLNMVSVPALVVGLIEKVLRATETNFKPLVTQDHHTKTFITNVAYKLVAIQDYSGKELNSMQEAVDFYNEVGKKIYGKYWMVVLLKNEIRLSKNANFGVRTDDPELVQYIQKRLAETDSNISISYNMPTASTAVEAETEKNNKQDKKLNKNKANETKKEIENV